MSLCSSYIITIAASLLVGYIARRPYAAIKDACRSFILIYVEGIHCTKDVHMIENTIYKCDRIWEKVRSSHI